MVRHIQNFEKQVPTAKTALPAKLSLRIKGQIKSFPGKEKLKESIITKPLLYEMLKGLREKNQNHEPDMYLLP